MSEHTDILLGWNTGHKFTSEGYDFYQIPPIYCGICHTICGTRIEDDKIMIEKYCHCEKQNE